MSKLQLKSDDSAVFKTVKNTSLQGFSIILNSDYGYRSVWLSPKQKIKILESEITQQVKNLRDRRLVSIEN